MNDFLTSVSILVAACFMLCAARPAEARTFSPYRQYNSRLFAQLGFKPSFQKQWGPTSTRTGVQVEGERRGVVEVTVSPVLLPLSVSSFRVVSSPVMPKRIAAGVSDIDDEHRLELEVALQGLLKGYEDLLDQHDDQRLKNNLAGAFNYLFGSCYATLKNGQRLNAAQQKSMLEQINAGISMALKEQRLSDREKQELYESVVLSGTIITGLYNEGRDKAELAKLARDMARDLLEQMLGITLEKVHLEGDAVRID